MGHGHGAVILLPALIVAAAILMPSAASVFGVTVVTAVQDAGAVEAVLNLDRPTRRLIQQGLAAEGFDPGVPDGLFGPRTRAAIRAWQAARDERQTGYLDGEQVAALQATAIPRPMTALPEPNDPAPASAPVAHAPAPVEASDTGLSPATTNGRVSEIPDTSAPPSAESSGAPARASRPGELPPEILIDRRLVRVDRLLARDDHRAAQDVMNEVLALQREHALELPAEFHFKHAQVAFAAGLPETAVTSLNDYLLAAGREGEFYRDALELLESAEEAVRRADAERRRAEAARRRAEEEQRGEQARQQENYELARRQIDLAANGLPRDELRSGGLGPEMVAVAAGRFQFATLQSIWLLAEPHLEWVTFDQPFAISKYEVTRGEFERFVDSSRYRSRAETGGRCGGHDRNYSWKRPPGRTGLRNPPPFDQTDAHPVVCVNHRDAIAYAAWLSNQTSQTYRLPSPAEWQYAARAGSNAAMLHTAHTRGEYCGGANLHESPEDNCTDGVRYTAPVGRFAPNGVGVHDMIGNVAELVLGCGRDAGDYISIARDGSPKDINSCEWPATMGGAYAGIRGEITYYGTQDFLYVYSSDRKDRAGEPYVGIRLVRDLQD